MSETSNKNKSAEAEYKKGISFLEKDDFVNAEECFKNAHTLNQKEAKYVSYYGLATALSEKNPQVGVELCTRAIKMDCTAADYYLNLGKVYSKIKNRNKAMETFKIGLKHDNSNKKIIAEFDKIGQRKSPALPFLSRDNFFNIYLGKLKSFLIKL